MVAFGILFFALYLTSTIVSSDNGGISAAVRVIGAFLAVISLIKPKVGLYIITIEAFSVDFIKKVAVYYGSVSTQTVIDVLIVTMLAIVATIGGVVLQGVALRRHKITVAHWAILAASAILGVAVFAAAFKGMGVAKAGEEAFNSAVLIGLAIPMAVLLGERDEINKLLKLQFWFCVVWAIWGIKQYYVGFLPLEWYYAETGLSSVASAHMLMFAEPRPFGFGSGVPNYGVISPYAALGCWYVVQEPAKRLRYLVGTAILFVGLVTSLQRTALVFPFIVLVCYFFFRTKSRTIALYVATAVLFVLGIIFAEELLAHLDDINQLISLPGEWAEKVLNVATFSDRLQSWRLLKTASIYSAFGTGEEMGLHDIFSRIIVSYGVVGLTVVLSVLITTAYFMHRTVLRIVDPQDRRFTTFLLAATTPNVFLGFAGGGNFTSNPTNLQIWTFFGAAFTIITTAPLMAPVISKPLAAVRRAFATQRQVAGSAGILHGPVRGESRA